MLVVLILVNSQRYLINFGMFVHANDEQIQSCLPSELPFLCCLLLLLVFLQEQHIEQKLEQFELFVHYLFSF